MLRLPIILLLILTIACQKETDETIPGGQHSNFNVQFSYLFGDDTMYLNQPYINSLGEEINVSAFRFYVHGFQLSNHNSGTVKQAGNDSYYLVDIDNAGSGQILLEVENGEYTHLSFVIGVDSALNVSGAQDGVLDPGHGMFWTWNSGYIMAKLEGTSPAATTQNNSFEYHIGGFRSPHNVVKRIEIALPGTFNPSAYSSALIGINADLNNWFDNVHQLSVASTPVCTTPGALAYSIAENYHGMFSINQISDHP